MKRQDIMLIVAAGMLSALFGRTAGAHGVVVRPSSGVTQAPASVSVDVEVLGQVASTRVDLMFRTAGPGTVKFLFPTPADASVTGFAVRRGGVWQDATMTADAPTSASDVRTGGGRSRSVALPDDLLSWLGDNAFVVDVPLTEDDVITRVRVTYIEVLPYDFGEVSYTFPLAPWASRRGALDEVDLRIGLTTRRDLRGWRADAWSAAEDLRRRQGRELELAYSRTRFDPAADFRLSWSVQQEDLFIDLLTHHDSCDEDGYFLLIVEPKHDVTDADIAPKYFTFVVDTSGSMAGVKMDQARTAAQFMVDNLNERDRFNVVAFSSNADLLFDRPQDFGPETQRTASRYIERMWSGGGTNIEEALRRALSADQDQDYARIVVLLTDGEPTAGVTYIPEILDSVQRSNRANARLFPFGVGAGLGRDLLIGLAAENRGDATFFDQGGDIRGVLTDFYKRIDRPVLTDVAVDFGGVDVHDTDLDGVTDLFAGTQLLVVGRYRGGADVQGALEGSLRGLKQKHMFPLRFDECDEGALPILPRLWAKARIDALIAEMAREGREDPDKVDEIRTLANRYGIQTPYTSFGVAAPPAAAPAGPQAGGGGGNGGGPAGPPRDPYSDYGQDYDYDNGGGGGGGWYGGDLEELEASETVYGCVMTPGTAPATPAWGIVAGGICLALVRRRRRV